MWASIYANIDYFYDGAFAFSQNDLLQQRLKDNHSASLFSYYSFVTLTTLGYGDVTPTNKVAEAWSTVEAMIGQFYVAIILARIVAIHSTKAVQSLKK